MILALLTAFAQKPEPILITQGVSVGGVIAAGRTPVGPDPVQDQIVHNAWTMPKDGDPIKNTHWRARQADKNGSFGELPSGYLAATVEATEDGAKILEASGDAMVYVNGAPRAGDPYGYGYLKIPVWLHKGTNTFLFVVGRGALTAKLTAPRAPIQIETGDLTTPDILIGGPTQLWAGVVLVNSTAKPQKVNLFARNADGAAPMVTAEIPAMSLRKIPVKLNTPKTLGKEAKFTLECALDGLIDKAEITLNVKTKKETHKETFISAIDGSLQYYAVNPAQKPAKDNALILSLHGASVEAIGQASAYSNKDWSTLVAPTNRRPYGFDWEDIGRLDALEVLDIAKKKFPHNPESVHLTGHSMGGHGTWSIGTLYPNLFASIAPSAGWISFWSYAGGYMPSSPSPIESMLIRSMAAGDTLARVNNTLEEKTYILHGDADDNVPVEQAREMKQVLTRIHADFQYHEQPGAGHWWGNQCVDWPGIFDQIKTSRLTPLESIDFTTPNPAVSAQDRWVTILQQVRPLRPSRVQINPTKGTTENVRVLKLDKAFENLTLDGQTIGPVEAGTQLFNTNGHWHVDHVKEGQRSPELSGPFKNVYQNHFLFVVGTHGTAEENEWAKQKARYDAETFQYRGNGAVDIVEDTKYNPRWARNVILYGNADTNSAWRALLANCPIQVKNGKLTAGEKTVEGQDLAALFIYPHRAGGKWVLVGAFAGTTPTALRTLDRLPVFTSGVGYPDWTILSPQVLKEGPKAITAAGYYTPNWLISNTDTAWSYQPTPTIGAPTNTQ